MSYQKCENSTTNEKYDANCMKYNRISALLFCLLKARKKVYAQKQWENNSIVGYGFTHNNEKYTLIENRIKITMNNYTQLYVNVYVFKLYVKSGYTPLYAQISIQTEE